ncbi:OmpA family protein [Spiractinospora alimapuensis]|uniref:OmpA family protein n=1 Tax=Spiractinospora alimapuensis TaxID=2820884 RepID=UPI001F3871CE|nr:OmpA family protein [Spiractinospora alimapuensis]QVQ53649.1 OmpA family protein [Spiractinospora alimapuensis]
MAGPNRSTVAIALIIGALLALAPRNADSAEDADVLFEFDEAQLTPEGEEILRDRAGELEEEGVDGMTINIDGHTDDKGAADYNLTLSEERAAAVETFLAEVLSDADVTFESQGHGEEQPVAKNERGGWDNPLGRAKNRRVEIAVSE